MVGSDSKGLIYLSFWENQKEHPPWLEEAKLDNSSFKDVFQCLENYFKGDAKALSQFSWKLGNVGTTFQQQVWKQLKKIKPGHTKSYGQIAEEINNPKSFRAVGGACNANPIILLIPCHRVTASNHIGGFGLGLPLKKKMLRHENSQLAFL